jgi:hypothetical protein
MEDIKVVGLIKQTPEAQPLTAEFRSFDRPRSYEPFVG